MEEFAVVELAVKLAVFVAWIGHEEREPTGIQCGREFIKGPLARPEVGHFFHPILATSSSCFAEPVVHRAAHIGPNALHVIVTPAQQILIGHCLGVEIVDAVPKILDRFSGIVGPVLGNHDSVPIIKGRCRELINQKHVRVNAQILGRVCPLIFQHAIHGVCAAIGGTLIPGVTRIGNVHTGNVQAFAHAPDFAVDSRVSEIGKIWKLLGVVEHGEGVVALHKMLERPVLELNERGVIHDGGLNVQHRDDRQGLVFVA